MVQPALPASALWEFAGVHSSPTAKRRPHSRQTVGRKDADHGGVSPNWRSCPYRSPRHSSAATHSPSWVLIVPPQTGHSEEVPLGLICSAMPPPFCTALAVTTVNAVKDSHAVEFDPPNA
nr:hypothetical protein [Candidatus Njordarchaeota archaeon]